MQLHTIPQVGGDTPTTVYTVQRSENNTTTTLRSGILKLRPGATAGGNVLTSD